MVFFDSIIEQFIVFVEQFSFFFVEFEIIANIC
jgi:hypothetical protein